MRVTVKDIANDLGISQGTVSKALMGKQGISKKTREAVFEAAERLGYKVNRVAQTLSRSTIHLGVIASRDWMEYNGEITRGIEEEAAHLADYNVETEFRWISNPLSDTEVETAIYALKEKKVSAVLFCLATAGKFADALNALSNSGVPTIVVGTNIGGENKVPAVRLDTKAAGRLAAEFMCYVVPEGKTTVVFTGNKDFLEHSEKVEGYQNEMSALGRSVIGVFETLDDPELAYLITHKMINAYKDLGGIYVSTSNSIAVCDCIEELGLAGKIKVVGTDVNSETVAKMKNGTIQGIIFQSPRQQGKMAVKTAYRWISERNETPDEVLVAPQLVLKSNVDCIIG